MRRAEWGNEVAHRQILATKGSLGKFSDLVAREWPLGAALTSGYIEPQQAPAFASLLSFFLSSPPASFPSLLPAGVPWALLWGSNTGPTGT